MNNYGVKENYYWDAGKLDNIYVVQKPMLQFPYDAHGTFILASEVPWPKGINLFMGNRYLKPQTRECLLHHNARNRVLECSQEIKILRCGPQEKISCLYGKE